MKKGLAIVYSVMLVLIIQSCKKERSAGTAGIDIAEMIACHDAQGLDTAAIANKLIGEWRLRASQCGECSLSGWYNPEKTVIVTFTAAKQFTVTENSSVISTGNWNFTLVNSRWGLESANP